ETWIPTNVLNIQKILSLYLLALNQNLTVFLMTKITKNCIIMLNILLIKEKQCHIQVMEKTLG
ncbi:hypothetical protein P1A13_11990, partial [Lactococcus lactis subsp. lactis]|uniref:hypothetical protein n=1 Tax=Lactococcus lactis TaxID=1358 RepID=UPI00247FFC87